MHRHVVLPLAHAPPRSAHASGRARLQASCGRRHSTARRVVSAYVVAAASADSGEDLYAVLGVDRSADSKTLKTAFRKLALKYHPDVNAAADAGQRFRSIKAAYTTLSDPELRAEYDRRTSNTGWGRSGGSTRPFWTDSGSSSGAAGKPGKAEDFYGLGDFFRDLDKELSGLEKRASSRGSSGEYASLLDELAAIGMSLGEELVEFLEGGITAQDGNARSSASTRGTDSARAASSAAGGDTRRNSSAATPDRSPPPQKGPPTTPPPASQSVDDMLQQLKKEMGLL